MGYISEWKRCRIPTISIEDSSVNMFQKQNVEMAGVIGCALPGDSLKLPGMAGLVEAAKQAGAFEHGDILVEATSGRAGAALLHLVQGYASDVIFTMKQDVPAAKKAALIVAGARVITPEIGLTPVQTARKMGGGGWISEEESKEKGLPAGWQKNGKMINLDQYACRHVMDEYRNSVSRKILQEAGEFEALVAGIGTGGTICGLNAGIRQHSEHKSTMVGVMCADGNEIPGMRDENGMKDIKQPWQKACNRISKVERAPAFLCVPWLDRALGVLAGPSGGATYVAACRFIQDLIDHSDLNKRRNLKTGKFKILFVIHDDGMPYVADRFTTEFALESFHHTTAKTPRELIFGK